MGASAIRLEDLPTHESADFEYKSSKLAADKDKLEFAISKAASAFWNSGGGVLVLGVDNSGKPDGGLSNLVGRKPLQEWLDIVVHSVQPGAKYDIHFVDCEAPSGAAEEPRKKVAILRFSRSHQAPHMARDNKYYVRVGAHTEPASQFIVEALWAQRSVHRPHLVHTFRLKPGDDGIVQLGLVATNDLPALDVELNFDPVPQTWISCAELLPIRIPIIDRQAPFFADLTTWYRADEHLGAGSTIRFSYRDHAGQRHEHSAPLRVLGIGPMQFHGEKPTKRLEDRIAEIAQAIRSIASDKK